jgi:hypothetical protein
MLLKNLLPKKLQNEALVASFSYESARFGDVRDFAELLLNELLAHQQQVGFSGASGTAFRLDNVFHVLT